MRRVSPDKAPVRPRVRPTSGRVPPCYTSRLDATQLIRIYDRLNPNERPLSGAATWASNGEDGRSLAEPTVTEGSLTLRSRSSSSVGSTSPPCPTRSSVRRCGRSRCRSSPAQIIQSFGMGRPRSSISGPMIWCCPLRRNGWGRRIAAPARPFPKDLVPLQLRWLYPRDALRRRFSLDHAEADDGRRCLARSWRRCGR